VRDHAGVESATTATLAAPAPEGLSEPEARRRLDERGPIPAPPSSRSYASIVRANVFTIFNLILAVAGGLTLAYGAWQDALFLGVLFFNSAIGITQEVRAKRALDRLAALVAPRATVVREGTPRALPVEAIVVGDLVRAQAGDQIVADGALVSATGFALDESILTGESRPVDRSAGDPVRSGSFVAEGVGSYEVTAVGPDSYAFRVAGEARSFRHPRSPLERSVNALLLVLVGVMIPGGVLLGYSLWHRHTSIHEAVPTSVAAVVTLVPEGLILLVSLTYAVAALRMARRGALVQQLNAVESLAAVDVFCLDKTGTLTEPEPQVLDVAPAEGVQRAELEQALRGYAGAATSRTSTLEAIAAAFPGPTSRAESEVPFSSARRWSAVRLAGTTYVLGAPELFALGALRKRAETDARAGRRVVALATTRSRPHGRALPPALRLLGLVVIGERLRADATTTVEYLLSQGVELKVLSGDRPETVAAIATAAGVPQDGAPVDGRELDVRAAVRATVVGRVSPEGKKEIVEALRDEGRYVAMVGDGVNDVPALKAARLAVAQGTGSQMARSVADLVLVRGDFAAVPAMIAEGRKILRNLARVAKLFVTKSAFAVFLIASIGLTPTAYPLLPRHLTLAASLTIGIPSFFLALAPSRGPHGERRFLRDVFSFAVPAGLAAGLGVLSSYTAALQVLDRPLTEARTVATTVLVAVGLYLILALEAAGRLRSAAVSTLCALLGAAYVVVLVSPPLRRFFDLALPQPTSILAAAGGTLLAVGVLWLTDERFVPGKGTAASA
jgi:cation-transporting ATPase E